MSGSGPADFDAAMQAGRLARSESRRDDALAAYRAAAAFRPADVNARLNVAIELRDLGRFEEAAACLEQLGGSGAAHPGVRRQLAYVHRARGDHRAAAEAFEALAGDLPKDIPARIEAARSFLEIGAVEDFERNLAAALALDPENDHTVLLKARGIENSGHGIAAFEVLDDHLKRMVAAGKAPHFELASYLVGIGLRIGRNARSEEVLASLPLSGAGQVGRGAFLRSQLLRQKNRFLEAESELARAVEAAPQMLPYRLNLAEVRIVLGRLALAEADMALAGERLAASPGAGQSAAQYQYLQGFLAIAADHRDAAPALLSTLSERPQGGASVAALTALASNCPDHVPTSLALLRSLLQGREPPVPRPGPNPSIPRTIFQFWDAPQPPADVGALMASWSRTSPDHRYLRFDDDGARSFLVELGDRNVLAAYDRAAHPAMRSDLFRLVYAYHRGGIYADADEASLMPLARIVPAEGDILLVLEERTGVVWNGFFAAAPRHPIIGRALRIAAARILAATAGNVWSITGPPVLALATTQILCEEPDRLAAANLVALSSARPWLATGHDCAYKQAGGNWKNAAAGSPYRS
ncbi:glycosyltransferase [Aurantimonas sp. 22II-16-19i]|uniref:glycosyltransferase n=1 Tax=Aurantimonas sp. 22II-16-19i TaxID=1317114 RepID=UPI0009F7AEE8|nr:glycosyltransferase [Aurantimonas sp. 22II-16-19i]ORE93922.1 hypothetical protein ATO4_15171 [Aurantimonas sp. 22II-16-19i]